MVRMVRGRYGEVLVVRSYAWDRFKTIFISR